MNDNETADLIRRSLIAVTMPFVVTVIVPALVMLTTPINPGWGLASPLNLLSIVIGLIVIGCGLSLVSMTINLFTTIGKGTLAPWDPTQHLVVTGVYRYVRNPMISGVFCIVLGEAALFGSQPILVWALVVIAVNMIYMPLSEEPGLRQRFGAEYEEYARHVPRWVPRRTPWIPPNSPTAK